MQMVSGILSVKDLVSKLKSNSKYQGIPLDALVRGVVRRTGAAMDDQEGAADLAEAYGFPTLAVRDGIGGAVGMRHTYLQIEGAGLVSTPTQPSKTFCIEQLEEAGQSLPHSKRRAAGPLRQQEPKQIMPDNKRDGAPRTGSAGRAVT